MPRPLVVHFINNDKFTLGYINFFMTSFPEYAHIFFTNRSDLEYASVKRACEEIVLFDSLESVLYGTEYREILLDANKIIISGVWTTKAFCRLDRVIKSKIYLQFWGADFYKYRDMSIKVSGIYQYLKLLKDRYYKKQLISSSAGVVNLISTDWKELKQILGVDAPHYVACMPSDPTKQYDWQALRDQRSMHDSKTRILVGNSASETNKHLEVFSILEQYREENIEIIVPLSYGESASGYKDRIIEAGIRCFGDKFRPIEQYMSKDAYVDLLNCLDVAIFNNNRQQAMGNINLCLRLGKKVYLRSDCSMRNHYSEIGIETYNIDDIGRTEFADFVCFDRKVKMKNYQAIEYELSEEKKIEQWKMILEA